MSYELRLEDTNPIEALMEASRQGVPAPVIAEAPEYHGEDQFTLMTILTDEDVEDCLYDWYEADARVVDFTSLAS